MNKEPIVTIKKILPKEAAPWDVVASRWNGDDQGNYAAMELEKIRVADFDLALAVAHHLLDKHGRSIAASFSIEVIAEANY